MKIDNNSRTKLAMGCLFFIAMAIVTALVLIGNSGSLSTEKIVGTYAVCCVVFGGIILLMSQK